MKPETYISVSIAPSRSSAREPRFSVRCKHFNGNMNSFDATLAEASGLTRAQAKARVADYQRQFRTLGGPPIKIQGETL